MIVIKVYQSSMSFSLLPGYICISLNISPRLHMNICMRGSSHLICTCGKTSLYYEYDDTVDGRNPAPPWMVKTL